MQRIPRMLLWLAGIAACLGIAVLSVAAAGLIQWGGARWYLGADADYRLACGQESLRQQQYDRVENILLHLDADGAQDHAHLLRGQYYLQQNRLAQATDELNHIRPENEKITFEASIIFGMAYVQRKMPFQAARCLKHVITKDPDHLEAHKGLATVLYDQGSLVGALQHAREWARLAPNDGHAMRFLGVIYMDLGDNNAFAISAFREALQRELKPGFVDDVREDLAEVLLRQTDYAQALEILDQLAPERKSSVRVLELKAQGFFGLNQAADLQSVLKGGLQEYPESIPLLKLQAKVDLNADKPGEAVGKLRKVLNVNRHDSEARNLLAQALTTLGQIKDAEEQRRLMLESQRLTETMSLLGKQAIYLPWDRSIRNRLAEVCEKLDLFPEAAHWRKAAAACPAGFDATPEEILRLPSSGGRMPDTAIPGTGSPR